MCDLMISSEVGNKEIILPTTGRCEGPYYKGYHLANLCQKISVVSDRFLFTFSGDVAQAKRILRALRSASAGRSISNEIVTQSIQAIPADQRDRVEVFVACIEQIGPATQRLWTNAMRSIHYEIPPFDQVVSLGSGNPDFFEAIEIGFMGEDLTKVNGADVLNFALSFMSKAMQLQERSDY